MIETLLCRGQGWHEHRATVLQEAPSCKVLLAFISTAVGWRGGSSHRMKRIDEPRACRVQGST